MKLSIIIPTLNDQAEVNATVASIRATSGDKCEIVVVDDASAPAVVLDDKDVVLIRNQTRVGAGGSRHIGALKATGTHLLLLDSHMRFGVGWYDEMEKSIADRPTTVHCGVCCGLDTGDMFLEETERKSTFADLENNRRFNFEGKFCRKVSADKYSFGPAGKVIIADFDHPGLEVIVPATPRYYGATLNLCGRNPNNPKEFQIYEGVWNKVQPEDDAEIACLMGACYFFPRDWFFKIGGLSGNKVWGSEEPCLSLKTYLSGGSIRLLKTVRIGHKFHSGNIPYNLPIMWKQYNKIRSIMVTLGEKEAIFLLGKMINETEMKNAIILVGRDKAEIEAENDMCRKLYVHDVKWYCDKFGIAYPQ